jgi:hypothetical protein
LREWEVSEFFAKEAESVIPNPRQRVRDLLFVRIRVVTQLCGELHEQ